jgi:hypothetical protein
LGYEQDDDEREPDPIAVRERPSSSRYTPRTASSAAFLHQDLIWQWLDDAQPLALGPSGAVPAGPVAGSAARRPALLVEADSGPGGDVLVLLEREAERAATDSETDPAGVVVQVEPAPPEPPSPPACARDAAQRRPRSPVIVLDAVADDDWWRHPDDEF